MSTSTPRSTQSVRLHVTSLVLFASLGVGDEISLCTNCKTERDIFFHIMMPYGWFNQFPASW